MYVLVADIVSGEKEVVRGPCVCFPSPTEEDGSKGASISLSSMEYVRVWTSSPASRVSRRGRRSGSPGHTKRAIRGSALVCMNSTGSTTCHHRELGMGHLPRRLFPWPGQQSRWSSPGPQRDLQHGRLREQDRNCAGILISGLVTPASAQRLCCGSWRA